MQDPDCNIRQSGFALVGDLAKACAPHIKPAATEVTGAGAADAYWHGVLPADGCVGVPWRTQIFGSVVYNLDPQMVNSRTMSACNNAVWSAGAQRLGSPPVCVCSSTSPASAQHPVALEQASWR